jgi:predicted XRE-type DNA-binding protein
MEKTPQVNPTHAGGSFDDFLREEGIFEEVNAHAVKEVIAWQIAQEMKLQGINKTAMARLMGTSRSSLDRLLDPQHDSLALATLTRAASVLGKAVRVSLE